MNRSIPSITILSLALLTLGACKVTKTYQSPEVATAGLDRDVTADDTANLASLSWREVFPDPALQGLIAEGIDRNLDLQAAYARVQQSRAYYAQSRAAFFPSIGASTQVTESKLSEVQGFGIRTSATQFQLGVNASWEANIWGKLSSARRAALAQLMQSEDYRRAVQTRLVADIAGYYYSLLAMDRQLEITRQTVRYWDTTVQTMSALKDAARVTGAAVVQSEASRYAAAVTIPDLQQNIRTTENALSIVLGREPGPIARGAIETQQTIARLETGVPAQLLSNRPDVRQAENNLRYYFEQTNVARTYFYPNLTITGSAGISSLALSTFFSPGSIFASLGAGLVQPIFNQRLNRTRLEVARAQQQEALLAFQNSLLNAGREVSDALSLYQTAADKIRVRSLQLTALERSVEYSMELLHNGFAIYPEVITARQSLLVAELNRVNDRLQQLQAVVNLYSALGGGWR